MTESEYTKSINPEHLFEEQATDYKWYEDEINSDSLILANQVNSKIYLFNFSYHQKIPSLSVTELRGSNLSISVHDLKYVENKNIEKSTNSNVLDESIGNASKQDDKEGKKY